MNASFLCDGRWMLAVMMGALCASPAPQAQASCPAVWLGWMCGQNSLLDMEEEPAVVPPKPVVNTPPIGPPTTQVLPSGSSNATTPSPAVSLSEEETGFAPPRPAVPVRAPTGALDDLITKSPEDAAIKVEAEPVCDLLIRRLRGDTVTVPIRLLRAPLNLPLPPNESFEFARLGTSGQPNGSTTREWKLSLTGSEIHNILYYEERMLRKAAEAFGVSTAELIRPLEPISLLEPETMQQARRAIALLSLALNEHESAKSRRLRRGTEWDGDRDDLAMALLNLQLAQVRLLIATGEKQKAIAALDRLRVAPALQRWSQTLLKRQYEELMLDPALTAVTSGDVIAARLAWEEFSARFPADAGEKSRRVREAIIAQAKALVDRAQAENDPRWLDEAKKIWPQLAGLDDVRRHMTQVYPVLECAFSTLPRRFSPLTARTAVDRYATTLLFESLMQWKQDDRTAPHYATQLAAHRPLAQARGRQFDLPRSLWSDSGDQPHYCTAEDVRWTVRLFKSVRPIGYSSAWQELFDDVHEASHPDPFRVSLRLHRDYWQPLALMDFPILPKSSFPTCCEDPSELEGFDRAPVGTGPYQRRPEADTASSVRFVANPLYREPGLPQIREIVFHQLDAIEARDHFLKGNVQLICGVRPTHVVELRQQGKRVDKVSAGGVYFLAPNHRRPLLQNREFRLALAHGIDREAILKTHFRPGNATRDHHALNGPFLANTWAFNPQVPAYSPAEAPVHLRAGLQNLGGSPALSLIHPDRDPDIAAACGEIKRQWKALGIELTLTAVDPDTFHHQVVHDQQFDLAFWRHDFKDETYWLWPLVNPQDRGPGGTNFMGYVPHEDLKRLFDRLRDHKNFRTIRDTTHAIHEWMHRDAVVIPLWQLDTYVAVSDQLAGVSFSSFNLFDGVQQWRLEAR